MLLPNTFPIFGVVLFLQQYAVCFTSSAMPPSNPFPSFFGLPPLFLSIDASTRCLGSCDVEFLCYLDTGAGGAGGAGPLTGRYHHDMTTPHTGIDKPTLQGE